MNVMHIALLQNLENLLDGSKCMGKQRYVKYK